MSETNTAAAGVAESAEILAARLAAIQIEVEQLQAAAEALAHHATPGAIHTDEYEAWLRVKLLAGYVGEDGSLSKAASALKETVQTYLWQRMEETGVSATKLPELGYGFTQTHMIYPSLNKSAVAEQGISEEEAIEQVMQFVADMGAEDLVDKKPRVVWQRMRGQEYMGKWLAEGVILPDVINATPRPTVQVRKL